MSAVPTLTHPPAPDPTHPLRRMPTADELPCDDGEPMETYWHRQAMNLLIDQAEYHLRDRTDVYVGGNMFVYFSHEHVFNKEFRGPDFFLVNGGIEGDKDRKSWVMWEEHNRLPDVIIELVSDTTGHIDRVVKKELYAKEFGTHEYYVVDPATNSVEGWRLVPRSRRYVPISPRDGRLWCEVLGVWLGFWHGLYPITKRVSKDFPRFFNDDGQVLPTKDEAADAAAAAQQQRADAQQERAETAEAENARLQAELAALRNPPPTP